MAAMTCSLLVIFGEIEARCGVKVNRGLKIRSRILGFLSSGTGEFEMETNEWQLNWLVQGVKSVTKDFSGHFVVQCPVLDRSEFCRGDV